MILGDRKSKPGDLGENVIFAGLGLVGMRKGTRLIFVNSTTIKNPDETRHRLLLHADALRGDLASSATSETVAIVQRQDALTCLPQTFATFLAIRHYPLSSLLLLFILLILNAWLQNN